MVTKTKATEYELEFRRDEEHQSYGGPFIRYRVNPRSNDDAIVITYGFSSRDAKNYTRWMGLDLHQVVQLRDFLNSIITKEAMKDKYCFIFSYGPNMLYRRIFKRVQSVRVVGTYEVKGYKLVFNQKSKDGSVEANIVKSLSAANSIWGVVHRIDLADKPILDRSEGLRYGDEQIDLHLRIGDDDRVLYAYNSPRLNTQSDVLPYDWYVDLMIAGAEENGLPEEYVNRLRTFKVQSDPDKDRERLNREILERSR